MYILYMFAVFKVYDLETIGNLETHDRIYAIFFSDALHVYRVLISVQAKSTYRNVGIFLGLCSTIMYLLYICHLRLKQKK